MIFVILFVMLFAGGNAYAQSTFNMNLLELIKNTFLLLQEQANGELDNDIESINQKTNEEINSYVDSKASEFVNRVYVEKDISAENYEKELNLYIEDLKTELNIESNKEIEAIKLKFNEKVQHELEKAKTNVQKEFEKALIEAAEKYNGN